MEYETYVNSGENINYAALPGFLLTYILGREPCTWFIRVYISSYKSNQILFRGNRQGEPPRHPGNQMLARCNNRERCR